MAAKKLSFYAVAKRMGVDASWLRRVNRGARPPNPDWVEGLADALELTGNDRRDFLEKAHLALSHPFIRELVVSLRSEIARQSKLLTHPKLK